MSVQTPPTQPQPQYVIAVSQKETGVAYLFWFFFGAFGAHQFYLGKKGRGLLYLFTLGILGVGCLIDLFTLPRQVRQVNAQRAVGLS
jgi:TM2 domain-containing membrane protein YozV